MARASSIRATRLSAAWPIRSCRRALLTCLIPGITAYEVFIPLTRASIRKGQISGAYITRSIK